jgi:hypothetical protein
MNLFRFFFRGKLGTCSQNLMPTEGVEPMEIHQLPDGGILELPYKGLFLN